MQVPETSAYRVGPDDRGQVAAEIAHSVEEALQDGSLGCGGDGLHITGILQDVATKAPYQRQRSVCQLLHLCCRSPTQSQAPSTLSFHDALDCNTATSP